MNEELTREAHDFRQDLMRLVGTSGLTKKQIISELVAAVAACLVTFKAISFGETCELLKEHMNLSDSLLLVKESNPYGPPTSSIDA